MEIDTESLTEDAYKVDEFAGKVTLLVEAQVRPSFSCSVLFTPQDMQHKIFSSVAIPSSWLAIAD